MATYAALIEAVVENPGKRLMDIANVLGAADHQVVRAARALVRNQLATVVGDGPLAEITPRYSEVDVALAAARSAGIVILDAIDR